MYIFIKNNAVILLLLLVTLAQFASACNLPNKTNTEEEVNLIKEACKEANSVGINTDESGTDIIYDNDMVIVIFYPIMQNIKGGGAKIYYQKIDKEFKFIRGELLP